MKKSILFFVLLFFRLLPFIALWDVEAIATMGEIGDVMTLANEEGVQALMDEIKF